MRKLPKEKQRRRGDQVDKPLTLSSEFDVDSVRSPGSVRRKRRSPSSSPDRLSTAYKDTSVKKPRVRERSTECRDVPMIVYAAPPGDYEYSPCRASSDIYHSDCHHREYVQPTFDYSRHRSSDSIGSILKWAITHLLEIRE